MGNSCFDEGFINGQLCCHDGVVCRGEDSVHTVADQSFRCQHHLVNGGPGTLHIFDALLIEIGFGSCDGCGGRILSHIIEKADQISLGVGGKDQVHDGVGVQIVGGSGQVGARCFQRVHKACTHRVGHGSKHHGDSVIFRCGLHAHGNRCCHADHQVHLVGNEVGNDLVHDVCVGVAVVFRDFKGDTLLFSDGGELRADVCDNLVERSVIHEVADTYFVGFTLRKSESGEREDQCENHDGADDFFHGGFSFLFFNFSFLSGEGRK